MKTHQRRGRFEPVLGIILALLLAIAIFSFYSCVNENKVKKWNNEHPELEAKNCAEKYPAKVIDTVVTSRLDTFDWSKDMFEVNEYINYLNAINDSLMYVLQYNDTGCNKYVSTIAEQQRRIKDLQSRIQNIKPKIIYHDTTYTVIDSAAAHALRLENDRFKNEATIKDKKISSLSSAGRVRFWMLIAAGLAIILLIVLLFKKKTNPLLNAVT